MVVVVVVILRFMDGDTGRMEVIAVVVVEVEGPDGRDGWSDLSFL